MKNINIYIVLAALIGLFGCTDEYEQPYPVSAVSWYTSTPTATEYFVEQDKFLGFMDASVGELSHEWIVEEGNGFLKKGFSPADSLAVWVDHEVGLSTTEKGVQVYFGKPGRTTLRLKNTFSEKVTYNGIRPIEAVEKNGEWVIDTAFVIDVYGPIKPAYNVYRSAGVDAEKKPILGELILEVAADDVVDASESDTWTSIDVETGEALLFVDLTKEEDENLINPNVRTWTVRNGTDQTTYEDSISTVYFNVYGFQAVGLGNLKAERDVAGSPKATGQKAIPLKLNVIQSTKPFTYADGAVWTSTTSLDFNVTGEITVLPANAKDAFTVTVLSNENKPVVDLDIPVTDVIVDPANATRVQLVLGAEIYGDDNIVVEFDATMADEIKSKDDRPLETFGQKAVDIPKSTADNLFTDGGATSSFNESSNGSGGVNTNPANALVNADYWLQQGNKNEHWLRTDQKAADESPASMKFSGEIATSGLMWLMQTQKHIIMQPGAYEFSYSIFIESGSTIELLEIDMQDQFSGWATIATMDFDLKDLPRGQWVTITQIANVTQDVPNAGWDPAVSDKNRTRTQYSVLSNPSTVTGEQTFYLDNFQIKVASADLRP